MSQKNEGWGFPRGSTKAHYFKENGMSLCGKWGFYHGDTEQGNDESSDNCVACKKALKRQNQNIKLEEYKAKGKVEL